MTDREYRAMLKKNHLCHDCKQQDAYTLAGRTYCYDCAEKQRLAKQKARQDPAKRERMLAQKREQVARYRAENKCVVCGKRLHRGERVCGICAELQRRAVRKSRNSAPRLPGVRCWQCNKAPCMEGKKLCAECYEKKVEVACENLKKAQTKNHPWRKSNQNSVWRNSPRYSPPSVK